MVSSPSLDSIEPLLTAAQTLLGVAVLVDLRLSWPEAVLLLGLFTAQFVLPAPAVGYVAAAVYTVAALAILIGHRHDIPALPRPLRVRRAPGGCGTRGP